MGGTCNADMPELTASEIVIAYAEHGISCTASSGGWSSNPTLSGSTCYYSRSGQSYTGCASSSGGNRLLCQCLSLSPQPSFGSTMLK